ncbi:MAG TPA: cytochrome c [Stellaceae bacterium]|nr:cytochrome c [Stellaceae bacterium]
MSAGRSSHLALRRWAVPIAAGLVAEIVAAVLFLGSGVYNVAADAPHLGPVRVLLDFARRRSIVAQSEAVRPPNDLLSNQRIETGAGLYSAMCAVCHGGPGLEKTEMAQGLYPAAPDLAKDDSLTPAQQFWTIKHGVKLTAMPAWGRTHPDSLIWDMVAFLQRLPRLSPDQYRALVASAPEDHDDMMKGAVH